MGRLLMTSDRTVATGALLLSLALPLAAQQSTPTFSVDVKVVNVLATVRDKHGEVVRGLTRDDFTLEEDGRPQTIRYFLQQSELPLTLGLLVDTSMSQRRVLREERSASQEFLNRLLREEHDKAFVLHFDREVELLKDVTSSRAQLQDALDELDEAPPERETHGNGGPRGGWPGGRGGRGGGAGGTLLYDAVFLASDELMGKQQGRKAVIILSDGVDTGSKLPLGSAIEAAQRADTIVYSILFSDEQAYAQPDFGRGGGMGRGGRGGMGRRGGGGPPQREESHPDGKKILEQISRATGGRLFQVSHKLTVAQIYAQIEDELRNQYNLGYSSDRPPIEPGYRKIHLATKHKDQVVQARDGYYAGAAVHSAAAGQ